MLSGLQKEATSPHTILGKLSRTCPKIKPWHRQWETGISCQRTANSVQEQDGWYLQREWGDDDWKVELTMWPLNCHQEPEREEGEKLNTSNVFKNNSNTKWPANICEKCLVPRLQNVCYFLIFCLKCYVEVFSSYTMAMGKEMVEGDITSLLSKAWWDNTG